METKDQGAILPIVLVIVLILSVSLLGIASYVGADLHYGRIAADRADRLAAADGVMNYAIDQLKLRNAACLQGGSGALPGLNSPINGATTTVTCTRQSTGASDMQGWAAVITGVGVPTTGTDQVLMSSQSGNPGKVLNGPVFMQRAKAANFALQTDVMIKDGPLYYTDPGCGTPAAVPAQPPTNSGKALVFQPAKIYGAQCGTLDWTADNIGGDPVVPNLAGLAPGVVTPGPPCAVFSPGKYTVLPDFSKPEFANVYFQSGDYYLENVPLVVKGSTITAGFPNPTLVTAAELANPACAAAMAADPNKATPGATFYLGGSSYIQIESGGALEIMPRLQGVNYVSIHALCAGLSGCDQTGGAGILPSTLGYDSTIATVSTDSGNNKQLITWGLLYTPKGRLAFGNVSNTAEQKLMGGLVVAKLVIQSSTSAVNFQISTIISPVDVKMVLVATATKNGTTTIKSVVDYRPYEIDLDDRLAISSWRVT